MLDFDSYRMRSIIVSEVWLLTVRSVIIGNYIVTQPEGLGMLSAIKCTFHHNDRYIQTRFQSQSQIPLFHISVGRRVFKPRSFYSCNRATTARQTAHLFINNISGLQECRNNISSWMPSSFLFWMVVPCAILHPILNGCASRWACYSNKDSLCAQICDLSFQIKEAHHRT